MKKFVVKIFVILLFLSSNSFAEVKPIFKQKLSLNGIINSPSEVSLSPNGKKIFFTVFATNKFEQYTLTDPFDISSLDTSTKIEFDLNAGSDKVNSAQGHAFNSDGTKFFVVSKTEGATQLNAHSLSRPYDLSSDISQIADDGIDWVTAFSAGDGAVHAQDITFNNDGTKMYLFDAGHQSAADGGVVEYNLSTPYDTSTASFVNELVTTSVLSRFEQDVEFDDDGTRMYIIDSSNVNASTKIGVYKLSTPYHTSTATFVGSIANFFDASGATGTPLGLGFSSDGMKLYQVTYHNTGAGVRDALYEYDLTCPYGIVICENETASVIGAQVEIAKNVIHQNTSTIFKRFEWLRKNDNRTDFNSHNINLNINNPILASLKTKLQTSFKDTQYVQASIKKSKLPGNKNNWSHWSHGDISFGRVGETLSLKAKDIKTKGIMIGADKKMINNRIFGLALRYGNDDIDIKSFGGEELNSQALSLNIYGSLPVNDKSNLNALLGASFLSIDQLISGAITGERNGRQVFTSFSYETEQNYTKYDLIPYGKAEMGVTQFSDYTDYGTASTNSVETHERLTFRTGNVSTGFKFDSILYMEDSQISRNGFLEYVADLTSDIDHYYKNHIDNVTLKNSIKRYSKSNIKGNIGFEFIKKDGHTIAINYERFQSLSNSGHTDSLLFKFGKKQNESTNFNAVYDPTHNNRAEINYLKELEKFNLKLSSNYSLFNKIPDYGANIQISGNF